jgi:hypothetical protein
VGDGLGDGLAVVGLGLGDGVVGLGLGDGEEPPVLTENEFVASPAPPCHSSKPASMSISHQDGWM